MGTKDNFLFGAAYYAEYMPYDRIDEDFSLMKKAGMNVIRIAESTWSTWEPEDGVFDFTLLNRVIKKAKEYGLSVIMGTPTYAIPSWLARKHPGILSTTRNGKELYGRRQIFDLTDPDYRFHAERIIRKMMEEIKPYDNIIGFQLDNETRSAEASGPEIQKIFRERLKEKFPDINCFNREFGLSYWSNSISKWDDLPDIRGTINGSLSAEYKAFLRDVITEFLSWQADIINEYRKPGQFITHNFDFSWYGYSFGMQPLVDQKKAARCMDIAGVDIYHHSQDRLDGAMISFGGAIGYSLKRKPYLVLETQSQGQVEWMPYKGQLRLQAYSHIASGAGSLMYWNWHSIHNSIESYWMGILSHDLIPGEVYNELKDFKRELDALPVDITSLTKKNEVAVIADNRSLTGLDEFPPGNEGLDYNHILRRIFDSLHKMNIEADIIYPEDDPESYRVVIVPALYSVTEDMITKLRKYVLDGGHIIMTFKSLFSDEHLKIYHEKKPYKMTDIAKMSYDRFTIPSGDVNNAEHFMELLRSEGCDVWEYYDHRYWKEYASVTHNDLEGGGSFTYIGTYKDEEKLQEIFRRVFLQAGIRLRSEVFPVIRKHGITRDGKDVIFYFNYSSEEREIIIDEEGSLFDLKEKRNISQKEKAVLRPWDLLILSSNL